MTHGYTFRDSQDAFNDAINSGALTTNETDNNFAGNFMYMHTEPDGRDAFKNIDSRQYLWS